MHHSAENDKCKCLVNEGFSGNGHILMPISVRFGDAK
jgi:hypothetical protein